MKPTMKYPIMAALIILIIPITACTLQFGSSGSRPSKDVDVRVGFNGLTIEFLKNTPPPRVFEGSTFPVIIKVKNIGAFSLGKTGDTNNYNKAIISLGVEKDYTYSVQLLANQIVQELDDKNLAGFSLEGKSKVNAKGGEEIVSYSVKAGKLDPQSEAHPSTVIATLCYPYETVLSASVCIDSDIGGVLPGKKVCKVQDLVFGNGQGAPVAVTKVEVQMLPTQASQESVAVGNVLPQFLILVENRGGGTVIKRSSVDDFCIKSDTTYKDLNIIKVTASLGGKELNCEPKEKDESGNKIDEPHAAVKLKDKRELARCTLKEGTPVPQGAYLSPISITLSYGYSQTISANYFIEKTAR